MEWILMFNLAKILMEKYKTFFVKMALNNLMNQ